MARKGSKSSGKLARNLALVMAAFGLLGGLLIAIALVQNLSSGIGDPAVISRGWKVAFGMAALAALLCAVGGWVMGGRIATRITDVGLAVSKLGRGGSEVKVRVGGDDEVAALGKSVQYLATDLAELLKSQEQAGGSAHVSMDPLVKQLRDKTVPNRLAGVDGYEIDGALSNGSRGGLDYFDLVPSQGEEPGAVLYLVSAEALAHTNKVLKQNLPSGCCAKATLLQVTAGGCKLYQAGARSPLLICQRGEVLELNAEGIAIGLDDGPVFEKSLRPQDIAMSPGTRLVLGNDAMHRSQGLLDLLQQHSPRHTNMFMNVVLGGLEQDAGDDGLREDVVMMTVKKAGQA
jgi:hypothetical protein